MAQPAAAARRAFPAFPFKPYQIQLDFMDSLYSALDKGGVAMLESPAGTGKTLSIICSALQWLQDCRSLAPPPKRTKRVASAVQPKVYYCSRTHTQLSQFVEEFKKTGFSQDMKIARLASRKSLCINREVTKEGDLNRINQQCLALQNLQKNMGKWNESKKDSDKYCSRRKHPTKASKGCQMFKPISSLKIFGEEALEKAMNIEELVQLGMKENTCPYYGTREMVPNADLVVLPYQSLLLKFSRNALNLKLNKNVVIIDEAHNLADSLTEMYNSEVTLSQLEHVHSYLGLFFKRPKRHGNCKKVYRQALLAITESLSKILIDANSSAAPFSMNSTEENTAGLFSMATNKLLSALDIETTEIKKVLDYIQKNRIVYKVGKYGIKQGKSKGVQRKQDNSEGDQHDLFIEGNFKSNFQALVNFLTSLVNKDLNGRIIVARSCSGQQEDISFKFILLSGEKIFAEIMSEAHAIVLTGATLQPIGETRMRLFPTIPLNEVHFFSCNHIIPEESVLPMVIRYGPSGMPFDFCYDSRSETDMILELGHMLCDLTSVIPEGIVMFFPSFDYLREVYDTWEDFGILQRVQERKHVFVEPKSNKEVERILDDYKVVISQCCSSNVSDGDSGCEGALLMAVVGGKVSEGINFSDGMARSIIMVGLPYPNLWDLLLMERICYAERLGRPWAILNDMEAGDTLHVGTSVQDGSHILDSCKKNGLGLAYYENLCMKAVNQSVGRAIRHKHDYAAILFVDSRYASKHIREFPLWIQNRLVGGSKKYREIQERLGNFFHLNKSR